ncbi:hypothetical protein P43SY_001660 [Pythium insidiosum]|uniref:Uncharacterized protein n=1 Tax=Pythium insidiosum TaxID=114742 RepID=A0AAD5M7P7_PYTIN|nr:hypothetical protein P43SY_001660 [Pythium insidiosum]
MKRCTLSPLAYRCVWSFVLALHLVCIVFTSLVAALYLYLPARARRIVKNAELFALSVPGEAYSSVAAMYLTLAVVHGACLLHIVWRLLPLSRVRKVAVQPAPEKATDAVSVVAPSIARVRRLSTLSSMTRSAVDSAQSALAVFEVTNEYYDAAHIARELVETAVLSFQAYKTSYLVAVPWINNVLVSLLVFNCWATPLIRSVVQDDVFFARLLILMVTVSLDVVVYIVIPVVLFLPYYANFEAIGGSYTSTDFWYTDRWLMRVLTEWKMLFVTSVWDGLSKFLIAASVIRALLEIPKLIAQPVAQRRSSRALSDPAVKETRKGSLLKNPFRRRTKLVERVSRAERIGRGLLVAWGVTVLALHLHAAMHPHNKHCLIQVRPWLAQRAACSLVDINCKTNSATGSAADFNEAMDAIDNQWLSYLIIRFCPHVEITPRFRGLHHLIGFKTYQSVIADWGDDAAFTQRDHPLVLFAVLVETNMTELPRGLYHSDFPLTLQDVEICRSNLSTLPDAIETSWSGVELLVLEALELREFPPALLRLRPSRLSLVLNGLTAIPDQVFENERTEWFKLGGNPLASLPKSLRVASPVRYMFLQMTAVTDFPSWVDLGILVEAQAGGTPLCAALQSNETVWGHDAAESGALRRRIGCSTPRTVDYLHHYPVVREPVINP